LDKLYSTLRLRFTTGAVEAAPQRR